MHGRLKVKTTAEKQAEKEKERAGKIKVRVLQIQLSERPLLILYLSSDIGPTIILQVVLVGQ